MSELEELRLAYAECSRQRNELLTKLKAQQQEPVADPSDRETDLLIAELDYENRMMRARNERLQRIIDGIVPRLENACGAGTMPPTVIKEFIEAQA